MWYQCSLFEKFVKYYLKKEKQKQNLQCFSVTAPDNSSFAFIGDIYDSSLDREDAEAEK